MNHRDAVTTAGCDGSLIDPNDSFSSDVFWTVYTCSKCFAVVFTVEGRRHWWNHEGQGSPVRLERISVMRLEQQS